MTLRAPWRKPYLLIISNLFCNHKCSYCIQQKSSLDVRMKPERVDVDALLAFLEKNRIDRSVKLMGGEATLHPDYDKMVEGLMKLYRKVVITTNVNGKWYRDFGKALAKMEKWKDKVQWNTTFHPQWMEPEVYIERIRAMRKAGLNLDQVATTDTPDLDDDIAQKLHSADIGWRLQTFTGRSSEGQLLPASWDDINQNYPQLYNPSKYIDNYSEYTKECEDADYTTATDRAQMVNCVTSRFLIGPDNNIYPCHRHLYVADKRYVCGTLHDVEMKDFRFKWNKMLSQWSLPCNTKCNPCDFKEVKITPLENPKAIERAEAILG